MINRTNEQRTDTNSNIRKIINDVLDYFPPLGAVYFIAYLSGLWHDKLSVIERVLFWAFSGVLIFGSCIIYYLLSKSNAGFSCRRMWDSERFESDKADVGQWTSNLRQRPSVNCKPKLEQNLQVIVMILLLVALLLSGIAGYFIKSYSMTKDKMDLFCIFLNIFIALFVYFVFVHNLIMACLI